MPKRKTLTTVREVLAIVGEDRARKIAGAKARTAPGTWAWRRKFPADTYLAFAAELKRLGYTAPPSLWGQKAAA
jgi:hypothetical protein